MIVKKKAPHLKVLAQRRVVQESSGRLPRLIKMVKDMGYNAEPDMPLLDMGLDSMALTDLFLQIRQTFGDIGIDAGEAVSGAFTIRKIADAAGSNCVEYVDVESQNAEDKNLGSAHVGGIRKNDETIQKQLGMMVSNMGFASDFSIPLLDLGMDSLSITDFILQVNKTFDADLTAADIHGGSLQVVLDHLVKSGRSISAKETAIPPPPKRFVEEPLPSYDYYL